MSIKVTTTVWDHSQHSGSALLVMLAIADFADDHGMAFPGMNTLSKKARTSVRNLHKILDRLVESGELVIDHKNGIKTSSGQRTNRYLIQIDQLRRGEPVDTSKVKKEMNGSTPPEKQEVNPSTGEEVNGSTPADAEEVSPSSPKPSVNNKPSENPSDKNKDTAVAPPMSIVNENDSLNAEKVSAVAMLMDAGMHVAVAKSEFADAALEDVRDAIDLVVKKEQAGLLTNGRGAYLVGIMRQKRQARAKQTFKREHGNGAMQEPAPTAYGPVQAEAEHWTRAKDQLEIQLDRANFETWLRPAEFMRVEADGDVMQFVIGVRSNFAQEQLQHRLYRTVQRILRDVYGQPVELKFEILEEALG